ncbi:hypothetical protein Lal_00023446 [Lupinus albus]|nr:hypothetical protein Lal_00023446 [Lupinus albus]
MKPFFQELIVGCFVRVGIGRSKSGTMHRLCMVKNVDVLENKTTHKYLNLVWGNETFIARWQMAMVSDSAPREEELKQWKRMPNANKKRCVRKKQAIQKINTYVYSATTLNQVLQEKKSASARPLNIVAEKDRMRKELVKAQSMQNDVDVERTEIRLRELKASRQAQYKDS